MEIIQLTQGSREWHIHRMKHQNASVAPAMLGESEYKTRNQLMFEQKAFANDPETFLQKIIDKGHAYEDLARPLAEEIIGEEIFPVVGVKGIKSASFDGLTINDEVAWEHKTLNADIKKNGSSLAHKIQMEQQLYVSGAKKCLFTATEWDQNNELVDSYQEWYYPDMDLRQRILSGWDQFEIDKAIFVCEIDPPKPQFEAIMQLPSIDVRVAGGLTASNLPYVTVQFDNFLSGVNKILVTDDDFANGEETAKFSRETAKKLGAAKQHIIDQTVDVSEAIRTIDLYVEKFNNLGLTLEKLVKYEKDARKLSMINEANEKWRNHLKMLECTIIPINMKSPAPNFQEAMKGKRLMSALQNAVDTELANAKIVAERIANDVVQNNLVYLNANAVNYLFLFNDLQNLAYETDVAFMAIVQQRISKYKIEQSEKADAERARLEQIAETKLKAEALRLQRDADDLCRKQSEIPTKTEKKIEVGTIEAYRPSFAQMLAIIAKECKVTPEKVKGWLDAIYDN